MNAQETKVSGWYILSLDGCAWEAICIADGEVADTCDESETGTHAAAHDGYAAIGEAVADDRMDAVADDVAEAVLAIYERFAGREVHRDMVIVSTIRESVVDPEIEAMKSMLESYGDRFTGNHVDEAAEDWSDSDFTAASAAGWCAIAVWDASTAAALRDAGLTPDDVVYAADSLVADLDDPSDAYTDGCPIYAACNRDISVDVLITTAQK